MFIYNSAKHLNKNVYTSTVNCFDSVKLSLGKYLLWYTKVIPHCNRNTDIILQHHSAIVTLIVYTLKNQVCLL